MALPHAALPHAALSRVTALPSESMSFVAGPLIMSFWSLSDLRVSCRTLSCRTSSSRTWSFLRQRTTSLS